MNLDRYWADLVTTGLLGTDRREPPPPAACGIPGLADLAADHAASDASARLLQQVAACTVVRRAGVLPAAPADLLAPAPDDRRPVVSVQAARTWSSVVDGFEVLEDEWMLTVVRTGRRLPPESVPAALVRHRGDPVRHARVRAAAGPVADWLVGWQPGLRCTRRDAVSAEAIAELPALPTLPGLPVEPAAVVAELRAGRLVASHLRVLSHHVARVDASLLVPLAEALDTVEPSAAAPFAYPVARELAELARLRHQMLTELEPA